MANEYGQEILYHLVEENKTRKDEARDLERRVRDVERGLTAMTTRLMLVNVAVTAAVVAAVTWIMNRMLTGGQ